MQTIRTVRDERVAKYRADEQAIAREQSAYEAMLAAGYRFEMLRNLRLADQAEKLGLTDTAASYYAEAKKYEQKLSVTQ